MSQAAVQLPQREIAVIQGGAQSATYGSAWTREVVILGVVLCVLQILDGLLTAVGVGHFGTGAEGNALLRSLMEQVGSVPALIIVKSVAISIVVVLCSLTPRVKWLPLAMKGMIAIYLCAAIIPWTYIIFAKIM
jgi:uncharacterized membrane protein